MGIVMIVLLLVILFVLMRNMGAKAEMKRLKEEAIVYHKDTRKWISVSRVIFGVLAVVSVAMLFWFIFRGDVATMDDVFYSWLGMIAAFLFFCIAPYNASDWVITEKGVYVYNMGRMVPWAEIITTGIAPVKKNGRCRVTLQLRKQEGEMFKARFQPLGTNSEAEAKEYSDLIREFIHALDRKKMFKREVEEKKTDIKKRKWY